MVNKYSKIRREKNYKIYAFKDVFSIFLFSIEFLFIYIRCRKFNAEFNYLITTTGHRARFFPKK